MAQRIRHRFPKPRIGGSSPSESAKLQGSQARLRQGAHNPSSQVQILPLLPLLRASQCGQGGSLISCVDRSSILRLATNLSDIPMYMDTKKQRETKVATNLPESMKNNLMALAEADGETLAGYVRKVLVSHLRERLGNDRVNTGTASPPKHGGPTPNERRGIKPAASTGSTPGTVPQEPGKQGSNPKPNGGGLQPSKPALAS